MGNTYRVLPDALRDLKTFSFWCIPGAKKEKQPGHLNSAKWVFTDWQKVENLEWIGDALRLSRDLKVNIGLVVPENWVVADFDHCRDSVTGVIHPTVQRIIERLKTVVLVSSSGTGLHVFLKYTPDHPLPDESKFTNPDLYLDSFKDKKQGELKKAGTFVAINWHPLPGYNALEREAQEFPDWLEAELFIHEGTSLPAEPSESVTPPTHVSTPQTRAPREPEVNNAPFSIDWKPNFRAHVKNLINWRKPQGMRDSSHSGWSWYWLLAYIRGSESPTWDGAFELSTRFERFFDKYAPGVTRNERTRHTQRWHHNNVRNAVKTQFNSGNLVYLGKGEKLGVTPADDKFLQAYEHARSSEMKPSTEMIFLRIVAMAGGRDRVRITTGELALATGLNRSTVIRVKTELTQHRCLEIVGGNLYALQLTRPCG
jgi:hypothetical protein